MDGGISPFVIAMQVLDEQFWTLEVIRLRIGELQSLYGDL